MNIFSSRSILDVHFAHAKVRMNRMAGNVPLYIYFRFGSETVSEGFPVRDPISIRINRYMGHNMGLGRKKGTHLK